MLSVEAIVDQGDLMHMDLAKLESTFAHAEPLELPRGIFRGTWLCSIQQPDDRHVLWRAVEAAGFRYSPFWVDFDRRIWTFYQRRFGAGLFTPTLGPSRWRDTETVRLDYATSRLPGPIRRVLYDEVKPISGDRCLGMGGVNAGRDEGDLFFFALTRPGLP